MARVPTSVADGDDTQLAIIRLLSSGVTRGDAMQRLGLSRSAFNQRAKVAARRLSLYSGLSGEALDAVLVPRRHGSSPKRGYYPRYSGAAITVELAYNLDAFHDAVDAVSDAQRENHDFGNDDLVRWLSGWRPASHDKSDSISCSVELMDVDAILYVRPEGLRFEPMVGAVNALEMIVYIKDCERDALCAELISDVRDPASSVVIDKGARVALPLTQADRLRWECFLKEHGTGRATKVRVKIAHARGIPPRLSFVIL